MLDDPRKDELRIAIDAGDLAAVRRLLDAAPELKDVIIRPGRSRDYRPLTEAAVENQVEILAYLIGLGCDVNEDANYPMFRAALYERCLPALDLLVHHGAGVNGVWDDYGPPVIASCEGMAPACMVWLLDHGALISGSGPGLSREVAWDAVVHAAHFHKERPELLRLLLERGGDANGRERGLTALHEVARRGDVPGVRLLLEYGADIGARDGRGRTPIEVTRNRQVRALLGATD
jgi:ankyrin repeat protein